MEPFEINLSGEILTVHPQEDETFQVYQGDTLLTTLTPNINQATLSIDWITSDLIPHEYAQQIGELIEQHDM